MANKQANPLVGVLLGYADTSEKAARIAEIYRHCPYCVSLRAAERSVVAVYALPPERRWWLQWAADSPHETLGLNAAALFLPQEVEAFSPWARGEVDPALETAPCGADCSVCSKYHRDCPGCPATKHYHRRRAADRFHPRAGIGGDMP